jgi:hypothetical protein
MAEVSATLIGLFLVGIFFYAEAGFRRLSQAGEAVEPYFRAGTRIVLLLYAIPLGLSITLVTLSLNWNRVFFLVLSVLLVAANIETALRIRPFAKGSRSNTLLVNEILGSIAVVVLVTIPWILGGFHPTREDITWALLLSFASGFLSVSALVLTVFETAENEAASTRSSKAL